MQERRVAKTWRPGETEDDVRNRLERLDNKYDPVPEHVDCKALMLMSRFSPLDMVSASLALSDVVQELGSSVVFWYEEVSDYDVAPEMKAEPSDFRTKGGLVHKALGDVSIDANELKARVGDRKGRQGERRKLSPQAILGTIELGSGYHNELKKDDPRIVLPLSPRGAVPAAARGCPEVPYCMVSPGTVHTDMQRWKACEQLGEAYYALSRRERRLPVDEVWALLQGKVYLDAGPRYRYPGDSRRHRFRLFVETPTAWEAWPNLDTWARTLHPRFKDGRAGTPEPFDDDTDVIAALHIPEYGEWRHAFEQKYDARKWPLRAQDVDPDSDGPSSSDESILDEKLRNARTADEIIATLPRYAYPRKSYPLPPQAETIWPADLRDEWLVPGSNGNEALTARIDAYQRSFAKEWDARIEKCRSNVRSRWAEEDLYFLAEQQFEEMVEWIKDNVRSHRIEIEYVHSQE